MSAPIQRPPSGPPHRPLAFNRPFVSGTEGTRVAEVLQRGSTGGNGPVGERCERLLRELTGARRVMLTPSCTAALELSALLLDVGPGDEVVMPSFTFVSTANAFVLRGATPVFVDIDPHTLCLDVAAVAAAISPRTKAIVPVHYGGWCAPLDELAALDLPLIEDAAQAVDARYRGRPLGSVGALATLSFHETKNLSCGEGGALLVNDERLTDRAEVLQEKGTSRMRFVRGEVRAYTWIDVGSSFLLGELNAAVLHEQLLSVEAITNARLAIWQAYHEALAPLAMSGALVRPSPPEACQHNAHVYYVLLPDESRRDRLIAALAADGIRAQFHYVPLHSSPAGMRFGRIHGSLEATDEIASRLVRLPLWPGMTSGDVDLVVDRIAAFTSSAA